jgi:hypothetical protein
MCCILGRKPDEQRERRMVVGNVDANKAIVAANGSGVIRQPRKKDRKRVYG